MGAISPSSSSFSSSSLTAAVQRGHIASLTEVDAALLVAAHLADGRREHHLDPLHASSFSSCSRPSISWQRRDKDGEDGPQNTADSRLQHFVLRSDSLSVLHRPNCGTAPPLYDSTSLGPRSLSLCGGVKNERHRKKEGRKEEKHPDAPLSALISSKHSSV